MVSQGPVGYWRLDEANGSPTAFDFVNGHDGTHIGATQTGSAGPRPTDFDGMEAANAAVNYNGVDAGTTTGKSLMSNLGAFTIMGFLNPRALPEERIAFIGQNDVTEFGIHNANFGIWTPSASLFVSPTNLILNAWNHIAATADGQNLRFFLNGIEIGVSENVTTNYGESSSPFNIGTAVLDAEGNFFDGLFDEVALYDKALTRAEVNGIYNLSLGLVSPTIVDQPVDQTVVLGDLNTDITFAAQANGTQPISLQWTIDGVNIPGATSDTLVITNAGPADVGAYRIVASNTGDTVISDPATLTLISGPVTPGDFTTIEGDNVSFTVTMPEDSTGYTYQWNKDGGAISGATDATLVVPGVANGVDDGAYTVDVTLGPDMVTSDPVALTVLALATDSYVNTVTASGPQAYWRLGEAAGATMAVDSIGTFDAVIVADPILGAPGAMLGDPDTSMAFPGSSKVELDDFTSSLLTPQFTTEFWALSTGGSGLRSPISYRDVSATGGEQWGWAFYANDNNQWQFDSYDGTTGPWNSIVGPAVVQGEWAHVVGTYDGTDMKLYVNGVLAGTVLNAPYDPNVLVALWIGAGGTEAGAGQAGSFLWEGQVDEVALYDRALTLSEVQAHYTASFGVGTGPEITGDPMFTWAGVGQPVSLSVGARGLPPLSYQWQKDGADVPGATSATLDFAAATLADSGTYRCLVSNANGATPSDNGNLFVFNDTALSDGVSVNFWDHRSAQAQELAPADVAGYYALANWNNVVTTNGHASGGGVQPLNPVDASGAATTIDVRWSSQDSGGQGLPHWTRRISNSVTGIWMTAMRPTTNSIPTTTAG